MQCNRDQLPFIDYVISVVSQAIVCGKFRMSHVKYGDKKIKQWYIKKAERVRL
jgi:hypothetical protein